MSRIGKQPVEIKDGVEIKIENRTVFVKGPKGELVVEYKRPIEIEVVDKEIIVTRKSETKLAKSLHGLYRSLIANAIEGVSAGYTKDLEIKGIGYRAEMQGNNLVLHLGHSHSITIPAPQGITITVEDQSKVKVTGYDKHLVGQVSAVIKEKRKVEPYKGKGIRYVGESVRRKAGKAGKAGA